MEESCVPPGSEWVMYVPPPRGKKRRVAVSAPVRTPPVSSPGSTSVTNGFVDDDDLLLDNMPHGTHAKKKMRHNETERRRITEINDLFIQLRAELGLAASCTKRDVLTAAVIMARRQNETHEFLSDICGLT